MIFIISITSAAVVVLVGKAAMEIVTAAAWMVTMTLIAQTADYQVAEG